MRPKLTQQTDATEDAADVEGVAPESAVDKDRDKTAAERSMLAGLSAWFRGRLPSRGKARVILAALLVVLLGGGLGGYGWYRAQALPNDAAIRVGDQVVTIDDLNKKIDTLRALYGVEVPKDPAKLDGFRRDSAKAAAVSIVLDRAAAERGVTIADKTARDVLGTFISQQLGEGPEARDRFVQALGTVGTNEDAVLTEIKRQLAVNQLFNKVTAAPPVTDAEAKAAFPARRHQLGTPEKRELSNIVVASEEEARRLVDEVRGGASFEALAKQRSLDGSTKGAGGALGELEQTQLEPEYGKAAFTAPQDGLYGPVRNQFGWNVGKVTRIVPPVPAEFEQAKDALKNQLATERATATWRRWLGEEIRSARVEYAGAYRPADPDSVPPTGAPR